MLVQLVEGLAIHHWNKITEYSRAEKSPSICHSISVGVLTAVRCKELVQPGGQSAHIAAPRGP
jgi:hypothetical protein